MNETLELDEDIQNIAINDINTSNLSDNIQNAVKTYYKTIIRVSFAYVKNKTDAEDIAQDTFLTLMTKNPSFICEEHCKAWLIRVAINKCKNFLKSSSKKKTVELTDDLRYLEPEQENVLNAVLNLDKKYRIVIHLYYYENYSIKEIASILKTNCATIGTRLARGRKLLKNSLGGFDNE